MSILASLGSPGNNNPVGLARHDSRRCPAAIIAVVNQPPPAARPPGSIAPPPTAVSPAAPGSTRPLSRWLLGLTAAHTINDLYGQVLPPLLPVLRTAFGITYFQGGILAFTAGGISAALQPVVGYAADRRGGRRLALALGFLLYAVGMLALSLAGSYTGLLLAAAVLALASTTYHPQATTLIAHRFPHARGWASGIHGIGNSIGFALAPIIVATLAERLGWQQASLVLALPAAFGALYVWSLVREPPGRAEPGLLAGITRPLILLTVVHGLIGTAGIGIFTWLPAYFVHLGSGLATAGLLTAMALTAGIPAQPLGGAISDRFGRRTLLVWACLVLTVAVILFAAAGSDLSPFVGAAQIAVLVACAFAVQFATSLTPPVALVYAAELAPGGRSGTAIGLAWGVGIAIGSLAAPLTGALIDVAGFSPAFLSLAGAALLGSAVARRLPRPST